ncbi:protein abrupt-like [Leptidea sinapis]|uniref:BTB domain-containing protein n=1 Tax=Leptidea sinapis TaxID=189913 RepID=A0A5E4PWN0_9NEOP|nr:protein abrupt-like [Leptidea sinapis]VVC89842.1 unnamed protein product [Leptidea sinapis]
MVLSQFSLKWDSHKPTICSGFCSLQQNGEFVDMTLAADGHFVKVHQVLIALASPYLKSLISSAPCQHPVIFLNNVSHSTLTLLLEYIYTGEVLVPPNSLSLFIEAAKSLHIKGLENIQADREVSGPNSGSISSSFISSKRSTLEESINLLPPVKKISLKQEDHKSYLQPQSYTNNEAEAEADDDNDFQNDSDMTVTEVETQIDTAKALEKLKTTTMQYTVSIRGSLQVILNRYIYNMHSSKMSGVKRWRCADYRNMKCMAFLVTKGNVVLNRGNPHCHSFHDKKILAKIKSNSVYSALNELEAYQERERKKQEESDNCDAEYIETDLGDKSNDELGE